MNMRQFLRRILGFLVPFFSTLFVLAMTILGILFASGYSINFRKRELVRTGVINVITKPSGAYIWLNKEPFGKTNKALPNIKVGDYNLELFKEGYYPFRLTVPVRHGLASLLHTYLVKDSESSLITEWKTDSLVRVRDNIISRVYKEENSWFIQNIRLEGNFFKPVIAKEESPRELKGFNLKKGEMVSDFMLDIAGRNYLVFTNRKRVYVVTPKRVYLDSYLSGYRELGAAFRFFNASKVLIVDKNKKLLIYDLEKNTKILLFDEVDGKKLQCLDTEGNFVLLFFNNKFHIYNQEGIEIVTYDLSKFGIKKTLKVTYCDLKIEDKKFFALFSDDKSVYVLGELYTEDSKAIRRGDLSAVKDFNLTFDKDSNLALLRTKFEKAKQTLMDFSKDRIYILSQNRLGVLTFNKEEPDVMRNIGLKIFYTGKDFQNMRFILNKNYLLLIEGRRVTVVSEYGTNIYTVADGVEKVASSDNIPGFLWYKFAIKPEAKENIQDEKPPKDKGKMKEKKVIQIFLREL